MTLIKGLAIGGCLARDQGAWEQGSPCATPKLPRFRSRGTSHRVLTARDVENDILPLTGFQILAVELDVVRRGCSWWLGVLLALVLEYSPLGGHRYRATHCE